MLKPLVVLLLSICFVLPVQADKERCGYNVPSELEHHGHAKQKKQNLAANKYVLSRINNLDTLGDFIKRSIVWRSVIVTDTPAYYLDKEIGRRDRKNKGLYHYTRIWVKLFLDNELSAGHLVTGDRYKIASLVRTKVYQKRLRRHDRRIGAIGGKKWWQQSSHLTGSAVDISFNGLSPAGFAWLQNRLVKLQDEGKVIVVQESCKNHFHVMVLPSYKP